MSNAEPEHEKEDEAISPGKFLEQVPPGEPRGRIAPLSAFFFYATAYR
jgi:hypothetical protein